MPYRIDPRDARCVQVERRPGSWQRVKCHPTKDAARAHLAALTINVTEKRHMEMRGEFSKLDDERRLAFGWASVAATAEDGQLVDKQGDVLDVPSLEDAVYAYVLDSRDADEMHKRAGVGKLVESMMFTPDKIKKMNLPAESVPVGWWVGFHVDDDEVWGKVKDGTYKSFSIKGSGTREEM